MANDTPASTDPTATTAELDLDAFEAHLRTLHRGGWYPESVVGRNADTEFDRWLTCRDAPIERVRLLAAYCKRDPQPHPDHDHLCPDDVLAVLVGESAEQHGEAATP